MNILVSPLAVSAPVGSTTILLTPDMRFLELEQVGAEIWELLSAGALVDEIAHELTARYEVSFEVATDDVSRFIGYLAEEGVVTVSG